MKLSIKKLELLICMLFPILPLSAYDFMVDGICYNVKSASDLTCSVTEGESKYDGNLTIPSMVTFMGKTFTILEIEAHCFLRCENLESITLPENIIKIGDAAFQDCINLKSIKIPESVVYLGRQCFYGCSNLISAILPTSNCTLGDFCFSSCPNLNYVELPKDLKVISAYCFERDTSLESINIPETVERIEREGFYRCHSLKSINLPSCCSIGVEAFMACNNLRNVDIDGDIEYGAFKSCDKDIDFIFGPNMKEISLADISVSQGFASVGYRYTFEFNDFTFENSFNSLTIKDSDESLFMKCNYHGDVYDEESRHYILYENHSKFSKSWSQDTETVYLGRNLEYEQAAYKLSLPNLKHFTIGPNISDVSQSLSFGDSLIFLKSLNLTPPRLNKEFTQFQYLFMDVEVPEESLNLYQSDPEWGKFFNMKGVNVNPIEGEDILKETYRYDLVGNPINEGFKGIVLIRYSDGSMKKVLQK